MPNLEKTVACSAAEASLSSCCWFTAWGTHNCLWRTGVSCRHRRRPAPLPPCSGSLQERDLSPKCELMSTQTWVDVRPSSEAQKYHGQLLGPVVMLLMLVMAVFGFQCSTMPLVSDWCCLVLDCKDMAQLSKIGGGKMPVWWFGDLEWHAEWSNPMIFQCTPHLSCLGLLERNCYRITGGNQSM